MRYSKMFMPTRREDPADAEIASHKLLIKAGFIRQVARGIYTLLPLGQRSVRRIERIVREEMDKAGAQELLMPAIQPAELWKESNRWNEYGPELMRFQDRKQSDFCLGPTHEEVITDILRNDVTSYKQLPINLYQIQSKFRDEIRPRFGLMRGREFIMKDAYSFDVDIEGANKSYDIMYKAYEAIFDRFGFEYRAVEADSGNIGGSRSHEFQVLAETGEDEIVSCQSCDYAANVEKAEIQIAKSEIKNEVEAGTLEEVYTPKMKTIAEVSTFLERKPEDFVKTLIYLAGEQFIAVLVRGDHNANELKLKNLLKSDGMDTTEFRMANDVEVGKMTKAPVGFAGPVGLKMPIYADLSVAPMANFIVGANKKDTHFLNVNFERDVEISEFADLREAKGGDACGKCGGVLESFRGIEVGHIFYLGTKYSAAMKARVQNKEGESCPLEMGCYGIGITRILAAVVEQNHDEKGIMWPMAIAPFQVMIQPLQMKNEDVVSTAETIYKALKDAGIDALLDDRNQGAGTKFKDFELIGIPLRVTIGARGLAEGKIEYKKRTDEAFEMIPLDGIVEHVICDIKSFKLNT